MREILTKNEAIQTALELVNKEIKAGLNPAVAISVVAGRKGINIEALEYFYKIYNLDKFVEL